MRSSIEDGTTSRPIWSPSSVRTSMPGLPWKEIIGFRIVVDHAYHRLDYGRVWNTLSQDIPKLRAAIDRYRQGGGARG
jgi:uncharacterized protein with HEPN domain